MKIVFKAWIFLGAWKRLSLQTSSLIAVYLGTVLPPANEKNSWKPGDFIASTATLNQKLHRVPFFFFLNEQMFGY